MIAPVQSATASGSGGTALVSLTGVTAGNLVTVQISQGLATGAPSPPTDTLGSSTWAIAGYEDVSEANASVFYLANCTAGSHSASFAAQSTYNWTVTIAEWSGISTTSPVDLSVGANNDFVVFPGSTPITVPSQTLGQVHELILGTFALYNTGGYANAAITDPPTNFTSLAVQNNTSVPGYCGGEHCYQINTSGTSLASTTWNATGYGVVYVSGLIVSFVAASGVEKVSKAQSYGVLAPPIAVNVSKANVYAALFPFEVVSKAVVYAVVAPNLTIGITPPTAIVQVNGGTQQFIATLSDGSGVTWYVDGVLNGNSTVGFIGGNGLYSAPYVTVMPSNPIVIITAVSIENPALSASATVTLVQPSSATVVYGKFVAADAYPAVIVGGGKLRVNVYMPGENITVGAGESTLGVPNVAAPPTPRPNSLLVSKIQIYSVINPPAPPPPPTLWASKALAYAAVETPVSAQVSKALAYSVLESPVSLQISKALTYTVLQIPASVMTSKAVAYSVLQSPASLRLSKVLAYGVLHIPASVMTSKAIAYGVLETPVFARVSKALAYGVLHPPPAVHVSKALAYGVLFRPTVQISKALSYGVLQAPVFVQVSKAQAYSVVQPPVAAQISKAVAFSVLVAPTSLRLSKAITYSVLKPTPPIKVSKVLAYGVVNPPIQYYERVSKANVYGVLSSGTSPATQFVHNTSVTITGSGFGTKSRALAPLLRDTGFDAAPGAVSSQWTGGANPNTTTSAYLPYDTANQLITFSPTGAVVGGPHPYVNNILGGAHYSDLNPSGVWTALQLTIPTLPAVLYARWYERCDPNWSFTSGEATNDHALKMAAWNVTGGTPVDCVTPMFTVPGPSSAATVSQQMQLGSNIMSYPVLENPDRNGHALTGGVGLSPFNAMNGWVLKEAEICLDSTTGAGGHGYWNYTVNGVAALTYAGRTDAYPSTTRTFSIGAGTYARDYGPGSTTNTNAQKNWSYLADAYIDITGASVTGHCARVIMGNAPTLAESTLRAPLLITSWSNTSITGTFWQDKFQGGALVFAHVVTESGAVLDNALSGTVLSYGVPGITTTSLPVGTVGVVYNYTPAATGGHGALTWTLVLGPTWLSVNPTTGTLAGTPTTAGPVTVILKVTDTLTVPSAPTAFTLNVAAAGVGPQAMWPGYVDTSSYTMMWWPPTTQTLWGSASFTASISGSTLTISAMASGSGAIAAGQILSALGVGAQISILAFGTNSTTGTGGTGTYALSATVGTVASSAMYTNPAGTPDYYKVYRDGALISMTGLGLTFPGVTPDPVVPQGQGAPTAPRPFPWFTDRSITAGASHTYTVTAVTGTTESPAGPALTMTALTNGVSVPPTAPTDPATWIAAFALPTNVITVTQTLLANYNATGGLGWALSQSNIAGNNLIVLPAGQTIQVPATGVIIPAYTGASGWTYFVSSQDPVYQSGGTLLPYSYTASNYGFQAVACTATIPANATTATLSTAWAQKTGWYYVIFTEGTAQEERQVLFTKGSLSITWASLNTLYSSAGLTAAANSTILVAYLTGVTPVDISSMCTLSWGTTANTPCIVMTPGAQKVRFVGLNIQPTQSVTHSSLVCVSFSNTNATTTYPKCSSIYFDRCVLGNDTNGAGWASITHGLGGVNCDYLLVHQCYFWGIVNDFNVNTGDANNYLLGGGYHCWQNNYLQLGAENIIYGGAYVAPPPNVPHDIVCRYNMSHKPLSWLVGYPTIGANPWSSFGRTVKNHLEFKAGQRADYYGNLILHRLAWRDSELSLRGFLRRRARSAVGRSCRDQHHAVLSVEQRH